MFKYNSLFWEESNKSGHRQIKISAFSRDIAVINATRTDSVWRCTFVPLGFKFSTEEMCELQKCIKHSEELMKMMVLEDLSTDDLDAFIDSIK